MPNNTYTQIQPEIGNLISFGFDNILITNVFLSFYLPLFLIVLLATMLLAFTKKDYRMLVKNPALVWFGVYGLLLFTMFMLSFSLVFPEFKLDTNYSYNNQIALQYSYSNFLYHLSKLFFSPVSIILITISFVIVNFIWTINFLKNPQKSSKILNL